jgi:hypothetical protein
VGFIFTDCVVKNRGAIGEPWREFRREGNSYFLFSLAVAAGMIVLVAITVMAVVLPLGSLSGDTTFTAASGTMLVLILIVFGLIWLAVVLFWALVSHFMVPVMYRRRCSAWEAFGDVAKLVSQNPRSIRSIRALHDRAHPGSRRHRHDGGLPHLLCRGLPYVSTVLLLPAIVWLGTFRLLFIRQFGDQYDVWAAAATPSTLPPSPVGPV